MAIRRFSSARPIHTNCPPVLAASLHIDYTKEDESGRVRSGRAVKKKEGGQH